jgi:cation diffusion facilitator family transporter
MSQCCENKSEELAGLRARQKSVLKIVLTINLVMFILEFTMGLIARSSGLLADSLDMLGDSIVYAFTLYVIDRSARWRAGAAFLKGVLITSFGVGVFFEAVSKIFSDVVPAAHTMGWMGTVALVANSTCLLLLLRHREDDLNMRSTWICSRNDIISNVGVLVAAAGVHWSGTKWPDIVIGLGISGVFLRSAFPILAEATAALGASRGQGTKT